MSQQMQPPYATVSLRYIGLKERRRDNIVADSGIVWNGYGDVQDVAAAHVQKYLVHADVWERASVPLRPRPQLQTPQAIGSVTAAVPFYNGDTSVAGIMFPVEVIVSMVLANTNPPLSVERWNAATAADRSDAVVEMLEQMREAANDWGKAKFGRKLKRNEAADKSDDDDEPAAERADAKTAERQPPAEQPQRPAKAAAAPKIDVPKVQTAPMNLE